MVVRRGQRRVTFNTQAYFTGMIETEGDHSYLSVSGGDVTRKIVGAAELGSKEDKVIVRETEGGPVTAVKCRNRYIKSLFRSRTASEAYAVLAQKLADADIRTFFYDLWLANHNEHARKEMRREYQEYRKSGNRGEHGADSRGRHSSHHGMSMRSAASAYCPI